MSISTVFDAIPELAHLDEIRFVQNCERILQSADPAAALQAFGTQSGLGAFFASQIIPATPAETAALASGGMNVVIGLKRIPNQRIVKHIRVSFKSGVLQRCFAIDLFVPIQFLGYGAYSICHLNFEAAQQSLNFFFRKLAEHHCNFHRTMIFSSGNYDTPGQPFVPVLRNRTTFNPDFATNLSKIVGLAKRHGIVLEVCFFIHHSVVGNGGIPLPPPIALADIGPNPYARYRNFFKVGGAWQALQQQIVTQVSRALQPHWNVVFEVGNELRVPPVPAGQTYDEPQLKEWIDWVANLARQESGGKLLTTSTGTLRENERIVNQSPALDFCSFHAGQWYDDPTNTHEIGAARQRAKNYGDKHLVVDDDGEPQDRYDRLWLRTMAKAALRAGGVGPCSFNHKGPYDAVRRVFASSDGAVTNGLDQLLGLKLAWEDVFNAVQTSTGEPTQLFVPRADALVEQ